MGFRERYIGSIEYLRKMGFFEDYSNLTSEEILERIFRRENWLKESIEEYEDRWMRKSDSDIDFSSIIFDTELYMRT